MSGSNDRYEVRNEEIEGKLRKIAGVLTQSLPEGWGFTCFMYEYLPGESLFYISSGDREGNIAALERQLKMLKGELDVGEQKTV